MYQLLNGNSWNKTQEVWFRNVNSSGTVQTNAGVIINEQGGTSLDLNWYDSQVEVVNGYVYIRVWNGSYLKCGFRYIW